jgi:alkylation response protein AidB-like acyl-CoA dehydrogenase
MVKVWCSEMLDYVMDETVQIYGGAGYVEDYPVERHWRDARINRIFEGTNEINRLLVPGRLLRRALRGELPLFERAAAVTAELGRGAPPADAPASEGPLAAEGRMLDSAKKIAIVCLGLAAQKFGTSLAEEQEVLGQFADIAMETYALESALLRARKRAAAVGADRAALDLAAVRCFAQDALDRIEVWARRLLAAVQAGEALGATLAAVQRLAARSTLNTVALRRQIAGAVIEAERYALGGRE